MDEYGIIALMERAGGRLPGGYLPIGDDVSVIPLGKGNLVIKCDMLVRKTDVPRGMSLKDAARKSVVACVSDFASKGVKPDSFLLSLGIPRQLSDAELREIAAGFAESVREWGLNLVGGDTNESSDLQIDCTMLGFSEKIVRRDTAGQGQLIVVSGAFGYPPAGLKIIQGARATPTFKRKALRSVFRPVPRLKLGLAISGYLSSAMDSSDGLAICLHTLASMSGIGMKVSELPVGGGVAAFATENRLSAPELVLYGGEEYEIVGTMEKSLFAEARSVARSLGGDLFAIGETTQGTNVCMEIDGRKEEIERKGWTHLSRLSGKRSSRS